MKTTIYFISILGVILLSSFVAVNKSITDFKPTKKHLTEKERAGLLYMREEEKLAFDVYSLMLEKWQVNVFNNISQSEERHVNFVKNVLSSYDIEDPYLEKRGSFANKNLEKLYNDLIEQGQKSILDAYLVGAKIEDLDIADLDKLISETENEELINLYNDLNRGSRNHMRAFSFRILEAGGHYTPVFIGQERYENIINGDHEPGLSCNQNKQAKTCCSDKKDNCCKNATAKKCSGSNEKRCSNNKKCKNL